VSATGSWGLDDFFTRAALIRTPASRPRWDGRRMDLVAVVLALAAFALLLATIELLDRV
jgi:hypothetical protein